MALLYCEGAQEGVDRWVSPAVRGAVRKAVCAREVREWGTGEHVQESQEHTARAELDQGQLEHSG